MLGFMCQAIDMTLKTPSKNGSFWGIGCVVTVYKTPRIMVRILNVSSTQTIDMTLKPPSKNGSLYQLG